MAGQAERRHARLRTAAGALLAGLVLAPSAQAQSPAETVARALASDPVYVHPRSAARLPVADQGQVRLAIVRSAIGRIRVAVVPAGVAARSGSLENFARDVDQTLDVRGAAVFVAGPEYFVTTSYPDSQRAVSAVRAGVAAREGDPLGQELVQVVRRLGRVDPGRPTDVQETQPGSPVPDADDFLDDVGDAFRLGVLIVALGVALPFVVVAVFLVARARRGRAREAEVRQSHERSAADELVTLGDEIRALDLDTSMPSASRAALAEYEQALARYDQANELLSGEPTAYRVEQARAAIAAGRRHLATARERLG